MGGRWESEKDEIVCAGGGAWKWKCRKCGDLYSGEAGLDDISAIAKR